MTRFLMRCVQSVLISLTTFAVATPALPSSTLASSAVRDAMTALVPTSAAPPVAQTPAARSSVVQTAVAQKGASLSAAQLRAAAVAAAASGPVAAARPAGTSAVVRATAYNSLSAQTDGSPFITATGTRVRPGVVALSRDLLRQFPYGSKIMIEDLSGRYNFKGRVFVVEDTMAARKANSLDIWMGTRTEAINFGARQLRISAVR